MVFDFEEFLGALKGVFGERRFWGRFKVRFTFSSPWFDSVIMSVSLWMKT